MATTKTIGGGGTLFVGEDKTIRLKNVVDQNGALVNMTGWTCLFDVRKSDIAKDPAIFSKMATLVGVFNSDPLLNTMMWEVFLSDTELNTVKARIYRHSWKRMDDGSETVLSRGPFAPEKATAP